MAHGKSNDIFVVRFVATDRGVKAETRVNGKVAFPSNRGKQPQAGETWRVSIAGMNPRETVYFLKCIETVADSFAPATPTITKVTALVPPPNRRRDGDSKLKSGRTDKGHSSFRAALHQFEKMGDSDKPFVPDFIFAPGGDAYEQAKAWLTPVVKIDLTNLKFAHAQKAGNADADAVTIADAMRAGIASIDEARSHAVALSAELKGLSQNTRDVSGQTVAARKRFDAATQAKRQLQLDTLSYGRLVQSYKKQGKADDAEASAHLAVIKGELDQRRTAVNEEFEAAKNAASDAEMGRHFAYSPEDVDRAIAVMSDIERFQAAEAAHMDELKATVKRYEDRIDAIRKSA